MIFLPLICFINYMKAMQSSQRNDRDILGKRYFQLFTFIKLIKGLKGIRRVKFVGGYVVNNLLIVNSEQRTGLALLLYQNPRPQSQ